MLGIRKGLFARLKKSKMFRRAYMREAVKQGIAHQIRVMREARGWKQADLASLTGKAQSNIARLEDPDYGKYSLQTLLDVADAFDVWLSVELVSFKDGLRRTNRKSRAALNAPSFSNDDAFWMDGAKEIRIEASSSADDSLVYGDTQGISRRTEREQRMVTSGALVSA